MLVVWDIGISKARNYRLFQEVRNRLLSVEFWLYMNKVQLSVCSNHAKDATVTCAIHLGRRTTFSWTVKWPSPPCQLWSNTTTTTLSLTTARSACRSPTPTHWAPDRRRRRTQTQTGSKGEQRAGDGFCNWNPPPSKTSGDEPTHAGRMAVAANWDRPRLSLWERKLWLHRNAPWRLLFCLISNQIH